MSILRFALLAFPLFLIPACQSGPPPKLTDGDRVAIRALDDSFAKMAVAGSYATLVELFYTEDAMFMAPNAPAAAGRPAIEAMLRALPPISSFALQARQIEGTGDLAYSCGRYTMTMTPPGASPIADEGKFLVVYRRQPGGAWKACHDMFNSDLPLPAAQAAEPRK